MTHKLLILFQTDYGNYPSAKLLKEQLDIKHQIIIENTEPYIK